MFIANNKILSGLIIYNAVNIYKELLNSVKDKSIYIEEYARGMIKAEEVHSLEIRKMLIDFS